MIRAAALALTAVTGFSGLVYEVTWHKYLGVLLGSQSEATAAVLALFLGGLSAGYALFGALTRRVVARGGQGAGLLGIYAALEAGIGVWALAFPLLFGGGQWLSLAWPGVPLGLGFALDVLLSALLIVPPAILMGGTIPILTQALARGVEEATRIHAWVYGINTLGAFAGALAAGFVLIQWLGLDGVMRALGAVNVAVGIGFLLLGRGLRGAPPSAAGSGRTALAPRAAGSGRTALAPRAPGALPFAWVALLAGFAMMSVQTVLNRIGAMSFGASHFTFAMIVAAFVLSIALGSLAVSAFSRIPGVVIVGCQWLLVVSLVVLHGWLPEAPYWAHALRALFRSYDAAFYPYYGLATAALLVLLLAPVGLSGALLPLLFHHLRREPGDLGRVAGRLYAWNTVGSLLGALVGGYALLFLVDLQQVHQLALMALVVAAAISSVCILRAPAVPTALLVALPAVLGIAALPAWPPSQLAAGLYRTREPQAFSFAGPSAAWDALREVEVLFYDDDPTTSVAVREFPFAGRRNRSIVTDGKADGALIGDYPTMSLLAVVPALLTETPRQAFVIGYGTGVTAGELASLDDVERVRVAEISPGVVAAAPFFEHGNLGAARNPKVEIVRADAYRALLRDQARYDVIVSEPSNPWRTGVEMLYSEEFLRAGLSRLAPGGVYAQWLHLYEIDRASVELVVATYIRVFEHVAVWYTLGPDILLLGFERGDHALDVQRLAARARRPDYSAALRRIGIRSVAALLAHEIAPLGMLHGSRAGPHALRASAPQPPVHTLRNPRLSHAAARAFFRGDRVESLARPTPRARRLARQHSLLRRFGRGEDGRLPDLVYAAATQETCRRARPRECAALVAAWQAAHSVSTRRPQVLARARAQPVNAETLAEPVLARLRALHGRGSYPGEDRDPAAALRSALAEFARFEHPAAPFDGDVLRGLWRACGARPERATECEALGRQIETRIGSVSSSIDAAAR